MISRIQKGVDVLAERKEKQAASARRKYVKHTFADVSREWIKDRVRLNYWKHDERGEARALSILVSMRAKSQRVPWTFLGDVTPDSA